MLVMVVVRERLVIGNDCIAHSMHVILIIVLIKVIAMTGKECGELKWLTGVGQILLTREEKAFTPQK